MTNSTSAGASSLRRIVGRGRYDRIVVAGTDRVVAFVDSVDGKFYMVTASGRRAVNDLWNPRLLVARYGPIS